jgi:linearmycin/streptolysin S transport system permease protein
MQALFIAWKDTLLRLRDPMALLFVVASPLVLVLIFGTVFGNRKLDPASVSIVNHDDGQLGEIYHSALTSDRVNEYIKATLSSDEAAARRAVDQGELAAVVIIPAGFTNAVFRGEQQQVEVYTDPAKTIGPAVVRAVVESITFSITKNAATVGISLQALGASGRIAPDQQATVAQELGRQLQAAGARGLSGILLDSETVTPNAASGVLAYIAPAMLVLFLMLNAIRSGPHLLEEKESGTLARLFVAPVSRSAVIAGKLLGDLLIAGLQAAVLLAGMRLIFKVDLGQPVAVTLLLLGVILSITALGLAIAGMIRSPGAVSGATQATVLVMGLLGGSIVQIGDVPVLRTISKIMPNYWAQEGFLTLANGGGLSDIWLPLAVLSGMTLVLALLSARLLGPKLSEA